MSDEVMTSNIVVSVMRIKINGKKTILYKLKLITCLWWYYIECFKSYQKNKHVKIVGKCVLNDVIANVIIYSDVHFNKNCISYGN